MDDDPTHNRTTTNLETTDRPSTSNGIRRRRPYTYDADVPVRTQNEGAGGVRRGLRGEQRSDAYASGPGHSVRDAVRGVRDSRVSGAPNPTCKSGHVHKSARMSRQCNIRVRRRSDFRNRSAVETAKATTTASQTDPVAGLETSVAKLCGREKSSEVYYDALEHNDWEERFEDARPSFDSVDDLRSHHGGTGEYQTQKEFGSDHESTYPSGFGYKNATLDELVEHLRFGRYGSVIDSLTMRDLRARAGVWLRNWEERNKHTLTEHCKTDLMIQAVNAAMIPDDRELWAVKNLRNESALARIKVNNDFLDGNLGADLVPIWTVAWRRIKLWFDEPWFMVRTSKVLPKRQV